MVMLLGYPSYHRAIPLVSVSSTGEDSSAALERYVLGRCNLISAHVSSDQKVTHFVNGDAVGYIRQKRVEAIQLCTARFI